MKIELAQLNPTVGDLDGNLERMRAVLLNGSSNGCDLVVFPELFITGYPPKDLLESRDFLKKTKQTIGKVLDISRGCPDKGILFGAPTEADETSGKTVHNSAILAFRGKIVHIQHKSLLPNYDVFDESRYFGPARNVRTVRFKAERLGISICEDAWNDSKMWGARAYGKDPVKTLAKQGATILINISASPFYIGKQDIRYRIVKNHAKRHGLPFIFVNQIGANDELVFDGRSMCFDRQGRLAAILPAFAECNQIVDTDIMGGNCQYVPSQRIPSVREALVLGIRDYMRKCGFERAVLGLSGGIDSAVTACLAVEAIGAHNVLGISMPGPFSSKGSLDDARLLAENLGIHFSVISTVKIYKEYVKTMEGTFKNTDTGATEENIQARIRGNILMAVSNKFGHLVLSTGNKSELAVGYCTLYGDMSGGLAAISDVPKTMVYEIADDINRQREVIPFASIRKAPSAELKPNQKDQDTLPPYELLDRILRYYVDEGLPRQDIVKKMLPAKTVDWVIGSVNRSEYKRKQAAPGIKVTTKAFGVGRRMPLAAKY
jgi:NAD+ synthase (glutamine-hydrolysing)